MNVVDSKGSLLGHGVTEIFSLFGHKNKISAFVENCKTTKTDPCEKAFEIYKCYKADNLPESIKLDTIKCMNSTKLTREERIKIKKRDFTNATQGMKVSKNVFFY